MSWELKKLHPIFAAEATGVDLTQAITPDLVEFIEAAMAEYAVVVLPRQFISDQQQIDFAGYFGPRESPVGAISGFDHKKMRLPPYLFDASNLDVDGSILPADHHRRVMRAGDRLWHTDSSFNPLPTKWSMLYGKAVPKEAGNTEFADARAAYDALDDKMKERIDHLMAVHDIWHSRQKGGLEGPITDAQRQSLPPAIHPLVRVMPRSGRKCYMAGAHASGIVGMPDSEARALLEELTDFATQERFVYSHPWKEGDLVIWDNRCTLHRATPFDDLHEVRDMRRTTIDEYAPGWANVG